MNKKELIEAICERLKECDYRKNFTVPRHSLHITDDDGNICTFRVKEADKSIAFTKQDVAAFIEAFMDVVEDGLKAGDEVSVYGFGSIRPHYRAARSTKNPWTGDSVDVEARYVPKFDPGKRLRIAVRLWELSQKDGG